MSLAISHSQKQAFREIYKLVAGESQKLDKEGLNQIFKLIDYQVSEKQLQDFHQKLFNKKDTIDFNEFMKIFSLKMNDYTATDVRNAFKLIAKDDDQLIPLSKIKDIMQKNGMSEMEILFLTNQLMAHTDSDGNLKYQEFLQSLNI